MYINGCIQHSCSNSLEHLYMGVRVTRFLLSHSGTIASPDPWAKFEVGDGPCIRPPNILRSTVIGCEASTKRCQGGIFLSEIEVYGQEKGVIVCCISDFRL